MSILKHNKQKIRSISRKWFENAIKKIIKETKTDKNHSDVNIVFVDDSYIKKLNKLYLKRNYPTDVISFTYSLHKNCVCGDIFISVPRAIVQSSRYKHSFYKELTLLVIHGFLHLLGYDHQNTRQKSIMDKKLKRILNSLNG